MTPETKPRMWIEEGDEVHLYGDMYCVGVWVRIPHVDTFRVDLTPKSCRRLARSLDIAAELAEEKGKK